MEQNIEKFFWTLVVCRFGFPRISVTDNRTQFDNKKFTAFYNELFIDHRCTLVGYQQANGQTVVTNRILLDRLKKLDDAKYLVSIPYHPKGVHRRNILQLSFWHSDNHTSGDWSTLISYGGI